MKDILTVGCMAVLVAGLSACATDDSIAMEVVETEETVAAPAMPAPAPTPAPRAAVTPAPAPVVATPVAPAPRPARVYEVPAGTILTFTLIDSLTTETSEAGQPFQASLTDALVVDGQTLAPRNALARGHVVAVEKPGRVSGVARMELAMTAIETETLTLQLRTLPFIAEAEATKGEDATKIGAGAGIGAAIGAALGGGKGAALGAAIGGGGGTAVVLATTGEHVEFPSETRLSFELGESLSVTDGSF